MLTASISSPVYPPIADSRLILSWKTQHSSVCRAYKVHLCTGNALNRVIRVLVVLLRGTVAKACLNETARVRAPEDERSHVKR
jgi:hypothetical protein